MKYNAKKSQGHKLIMPPKPVFEVVLGCRYKVLTSSKIAAESNEEAVEIAKAAASESRIEAGEDAPPGWIRSMATTLPTECSLIGVRPEASPHFFDLEGMNIGPFLIPDKSE